MDDGEKDRWGDGLGGFSFASHQLAVNCSAYTVSMLRPFPLFLLTLALSSCQMLPTRTNFPYG